MWVKRCFYIFAQMFVLLCCSELVFASDGSFVLDQGDSHYLGRYSHIFTDTENRLDFTEIQSLASDQWEHSDEDIISEGMKLGTTWVRFSIEPKNEANHPNKQWQLAIEYAMPYSIDLYYQDVQGNWQIIKGGSGIPFNQRPVKDQLILFDLPLKPNVLNQFYLRVDAHSPTLLPVRVITKEARLEWKENRSMWLNIFYGMLIIMFVYNLLLGFSMKNSTYFLISIYIISMFAFSASSDGFFDQYFWPNKSVETIKMVNVIAQWVEIFVILLLKNSFKTKERFPKLNKFLTAFAVLITVMLPINIMATSLFSSAFSISVSLFAFPFVCFILVDSFIHKYQDVRYMSLAWSFFVVFTMVEGLVFSGAISCNSFSLYLIHIGACLMVVTLSFALAEQIAYFKWQKLNFEREYRVREQNANKVLDTINKKLARSNELKDQFLSAISHELRTPMNGVIGALELIDKEYIPSKYRDSVEIANRSAEDMMRLVNDLLCYCDLQNESPIKDKTNFDLLPLMQSLIDEMAPKMEAKQVDLVLDAPKELPYSFHGNDQIIFQALYQLLDNAIKFTDHGKVCLAVAIEELGEGNTVQLIIRVTDTGIGIEESRIDSLFSAFSQADGSHTRKYGGLGIGLSICHKALERIGGTMEVSSDLGKGTRFTVIIPLSKSSTTVNELVEQPVNDSPKSSVQNPNGIHKNSSNLIALVVDDNLVNQKVMVGMLKKYNIPSQVVSNGLEAYEACEKTQFDLILMDCQMPVMDGLEATRKIRSDKNKNHNTPIIAVTANVLDVDERVCLVAGMDAYLKKPIKLADIKRLLDLYLFKLPLKQGTQVQ